MMEQQKIKLGARVLTEQEMNLILPNSNQVYDQIDVFRSNISEGSGSEQKTNNIGIMGCRGAGKTSILKTFYKRLSEEQKNTGDILLPIVIPENMSPGTSLMDVILGMFKPIVKEIGDERKRKENEKRGRDCIYSGRDKLEKVYNDMVRQYCYIKKDYRDILIRQFTTEQYYLDKTKEVFNSDSEFIKLFGEFVNILCTYAEEKMDRADDAEGSHAMIFLFIDDIDLSTTRCMDVVKVLLSYLPNPRIVTFISGDLDTFEEALTLDFLRQENSLDAEVFRTTYMNRKADSLLTRKKALAYEYLRKVIPPAYRKTIKRWTLEERGDFQVADGEGKSQKKLVELLMEVTAEYIDSSYFTYTDVTESRENERRRVNDVIFHMFDDTSRGINNVYNVLQELWDLGHEADRNSLMRLIEAMIDSKQLYAQCREQFLGQIIVVVQDNVKVDFESAFHWLYGEGGQESDKAAGGGQDSGNVSGGEEDRQATCMDDKENEKEQSFDSKQCFSIFLLIDFAGRIFSEELNSNAYYMMLKNKAVEEYIYDETIDGKIPAKRKKLSLDGHNWNEKNIGWILSKLLQNGEFILNLYLVKFLGRDRIYHIWDGGETGRDDVYEAAYALIKSVQAMEEDAEGRKDYLVRMYSQMKEVMLTLLDLLPLNADVIYGEKLLQDVPEEVKWHKFFLEETKSEENLALASTRSVEKCFLKMGERDKYTAVYLGSRYSLFWIYYEICMREEKAKKRIIDLEGMAARLISRGLLKAKMRQFKGIMNRFQIHEITKEGYPALLGEDGAKEKKVIFQIDKEKLWDNSYVKNFVYPFLNKKRWRYLRSIYRKPLFFDVRELLAESGGYYKFMNCDKGVSGAALVCRLEKKLNKYFFLKGDLNNNKDDITYYMSLDQILVIQCMLEEFLQDHPGIKLGKKETRQLLMEIRELPLVLQSDEKILDELFKKEKAFLARLEDEVMHKIKTDRNIDVDMWGMEQEAGIDQFGKNEQIIENIAEQYCVKIDKDDKWYYLFDVQNIIIDSDKKFIQLRDGEWEKKIKSMIKDMEEKEEENNFYLHSYLRYLQAENNDYDTLGIRAEAVADFTKELLDNEIIAADLVQKEIYDILKEKMELTEEEFEGLFS